MPVRPVLLVEGRDDREVVYQLCNRLNLDNRAHFDVEIAQGVEGVLAELPVRLKTTVPVLGVVVDADYELNSRWEAIRGKLSALGYAPPKAPQPAGTIVSPPVDSHLPRVGVWVMPDNQLPGKLEDFLLLLVPPGDDLAEQAHSSVDAIEKPLFIDSDRPKAVIHTWLAWQEEPGTPLGLAVTRRYLLAEHVILDRFASWLQELFEMPGR